MLNILRKARQVFGLSAPGAGIDGYGRDGGTFEECLHLSRRYERRGSIHDYDVARRAAFASEDSLGDGQVAVFVSALDFIRTGFAHAEVRRLEGPPLHVAIANSNASVGPVVVISSRPSEP